MIRRIQERQVYKNRYIQVFDDDVEFADGSRGTYVRITAADEIGVGVVIVPISDGDIGIVRTYRYPLGAEQWALPRGFAHSADPVESARRELLEEMGATAGTLSVLGFLTPDSGLLGMKVAVVIANVETLRAATPDWHEVLETRWGVCCIKRWQVILAGRFAVSTQAGAPRPTVRGLISPP